MTGMETVADLRRDGVKPAAVVIDVVTTIRAIDAEAYALSPSGIVSVHIARADSLADIDFRPLHGLTVHIHGERERQARVSKLVAAVEPARLVVPVENDDGWTVHIRIAGNPPTSEVFAI